MIRITFKDNMICVEGHAGAGPPGEDIVCAAISALTDTLVASLEELTDDTIKSDLRLGQAVVEYKDLSGQGKLLIESFFIGVNGVAEAVPGYVAVIDGRHGTETPGGEDKAMVTSREAQEGKHEQSYQRDETVQV